MDDRLDAVVVGAGQAGLAVSHELSRAGVVHVVLERDRVGETWRRRWDSFCLVTPNWSLRLPGHAYDLDDPDGFMPRDEIVAYLERYAGGFAAPVRAGVAATSLTVAGDGTLRLATSDGVIAARNVVLCTGAYQRAYRPAAAAAMPAGLLQIDGGDYRNPSALPPGPVLVVGSGQTGCQIAEELQLAGRRVFLACGKAPWAMRRLGDRDIVWWLDQSGFLDAPAGSLPGPEARLWANIQATGANGGRHDLHYRTLQALGVTLLGHLVGVEHRRARFAADLGASVAWGDARYRVVMDLARKLAAERGLPGPEIPEPGPIDLAAPDEVDLAGFGAVVFTGGYRPDYVSWVDRPDAFDAEGFPLQVDGASTVVPGLYFAGVHFLRKRKSSLLIGVGEDAALVAAQIAARL